MRIGSSLFSLIPQSGLARTERALSQSLARLSSGLRINSASDDVAGFMMSRTIHAQLRGTGMAIRNVNDGMSLAQIAEGAMNEMTNVLQSIRELAVQAASGTITADQRLSINTQVSSLIEEYNRVATTTDFNGIKLLDGSLSASIQTGPTSSASVSLGIDNLNATTVFQKTVGTGSLQAKVSYSAGAEDRGIEVGDLNGDGYMDIVTAAFASESVAVLLGKSDGTYLPKITLAAGLDNTDVELSDLNGDGILDIVDASSDDGAANVLLGNGDGTFKPKVSYVAGGSGGTAMSVILGDVNGDEIKDILTTFVSPGESTWNVLLGNSDGSFQARVSTTLTNGPQAIALADINHDGKKDILIATVTDSKLNTFLGNNDGTFGANTSFATGASARSVWVDDLNADGLDDIMVTTSTGATVNLYLGNSDGTLKFSSITTGAGAYYARTADLNGDGIRDIVSTSAGTDDTVNVFLGNGDGSFLARVSYSVGNDPYFFAVGDMNRDGVEDIITAGNSDGTANLLFTKTKKMTAVADMSLTTQTAAQNALDIVDGALSKLAEQRSALGAVQNRLETTIDSLYTNQQNLAAAYGEIVNADIAFETAELVRNQIMQQAGIAMLSQANIMQAQVVELLRGI